MKRIATQENSIQKRILINIPFVLIIALSTALFGGGLIALFYAIVCGIAFESSMVCLILLGAGFIMISAGLGCILLYKKYEGFYNKKMGWIFPDKKENPKKNPTDPKQFKDYITLPNISIVVLAIGALLTLISALLGCTERAKWVDAISTFRQYNGYYEDINPVKLNYPLGENGNITKVEIELIDKIPVIIYTKDEDKQDDISIDAYTKFVNQLVIKNSNGVLSIEENPSPKRNETLDKLLFFVFDDFSVERQVLISIPESQKDNIEIVGENIIYPDPVEEEKEK